MAFAVWLDSEQAWAEGLHEYRPWGTAVIARTDRFRPRDFSPRRAAPPRHSRHYAGLFASLEQVNTRLAALGRSPVSKKNLRKHLSATPAWI
ncbi:MAG TPA: hypothetical protein VHA11_06065 [Bryobacteraceae bacterium]|nr:hypothetical protein [Bryobacteraceae bacterium]